MTDEHLHLAEPYDEAQAQFQLSDEVLHFEAALHLLTVYEPRGDTSSTEAPTSDALMEDSFDSEASAWPHYKKSQQLRRSALSRSSASLSCSVSGPCLQAGALPSLPTQTVVQTMQTVTDDL